MMAQLTHINSNHLMDNLVIIVLWIQNFLSCFGVINDFQVYVIPFTASQIGLAILQFYIFAL